MAHQRTSLPAWIETFCAIALVFITGFYTYYAKQQLSEMKAAVQVSKENADAAKEARQNNLSIYTLGRRV
jgi:hypothetical protein